MIDYQKQRALAETYNYGYLCQLYILKCVINFIDDDRLQEQAITAEDMVDAVYEYYLRSSADIMLDTFVCYLWEDIVENDNLTIQEHMENAKIRYEENY